MWQERGLAPAPSWQIWGLGWGQQPPGGIFGMGGAAGTQEGSSFPLGFPGAQWGSRLFPGLQDPGLEFSLAPVLAGVK